MTETSRNCLQDKLDAIQAEVDLMRESLATDRTSHGDTLGGVRFIAQQCAEMREVVALDRDTACRCRPGQCDHRLQSVP